MVGDSKAPLIIGCDHAAYPLKETVKSFLFGIGIEVEDAGTDSQKLSGLPGLWHQGRRECLQGYFFAWYLALRFGHRDVHGGPTGFPECVRHFVTIFLRLLCAANTMMPISWFWADRCSENLWHLKLSKPGWKQILKAAVIRDVWTSSDKLENIARIKKRSG